MMRRSKYIFILLSVLFVACQNEQKVNSPHSLFQELFTDIQLQRIYPDNKTFVDAIPKAEADSILQEYRKHRYDTDFNLKTFADQYFTLPALREVDFITTSNNVRAHIDTLWQVLERSADTVKHGSLLSLPHPYIVPGGRFREIYYWDSYFSMLGLKESNRIATIQNMVDNFAYLINEFGFIPNGNRTYYLTRSQPPFFPLMIDLLAKSKGDHVFIKYQSELIKEYEFWMGGANDLKFVETYRNSVKLGLDVFLNRYWDESDLPREESYYEDVEAAKSSAQPQGDFYRNVRAAAESGWDFSSRWFADGKNIGTIQTTKIIPVDLNCLLYFMEQTIAKSYALQHDEENAKNYESSAERRKQAIQQYCWDEESGWFRDYNFVSKKQSSSWNLSGVFPLFFKIASLEQAERIAQNIEQKFLRPGGLVTTLNNTTQQWDAPNGWAPLEYMAIKGLENYNKHDLAKSIAQRWINLNRNVFEKTGKLMEKYNVTDLSLRAGGGEYALQDGFGWTNGVLITLMNEYPDEND